MRHFHFRPWTVPLALLVLCVLSFGVLAPWLGFYWDDWPAIYYHHQLGAVGYLQAFAVDRPLLGVLFMLTSPIVGESALAWQVFGLLTRWVSCLAFWWVLIAVWPQHKRQAAAAAFLFAIYPGFQQQYISVTYSQAWIILTAFLLSLGLMVWAFRKPAWFWPLIAASWLLSTLVMFTDEYFIGLELLRPVLMWMVIGGPVAQYREKLKRIGLLWAPFVASLGAFLFWRLILHPTPRGEVQIAGQLASSSRLLGLIERIFYDVFQSTLLAWAQTFHLDTGITANKVLLLFYGLVAIAGAAFTIFTFAFLRPETGEEQSAESKLTSIHRWSNQAILLGLFALFIAGWPFWATDLPIRLEFPWDRFTLAMMPGASLFVAGLIESLGRKHLVHVLVLGVAVGLAAGLHFQSANAYRRAWNLQKDFFWQLTWRAPGIQPGTILLTADLPFTYYSDNSLTAPLNLIYAPENHSQKMSYLVFAVESRLGTSLLNLKQGVKIVQEYRATEFAGSTSQAVGVFFQPPGCLLIADPSVYGRMPQKPNYFSDVLPLSNLALITPEAQPAAQPPQFFFGPEPAHDWCYYFEKADLARQTGDWQQVVKLGNKAFQGQKSFADYQAVQFLPYIEGYARTGQWQRAEKLALQADQLNGRMQRALCAVWQRLGQDTPDSPEREEALTGLQTRLACQASN